MESVKSFKKSIKLLDATSLVVGSMIGSGIFIVSSNMARTVASPGWLIVAWLVAGIMTIIAALSYGELSAMMPNAGGQYVYLREAYNPLFGFLYGWSMFTVIQTGTIAALGMAFGKYFGVFFPWFSENNILLEIGRFKINSAQIIAITVIVFLSWVNSKGIKTGKTIQTFFTIIKVGILLAFIILGLFIARNQNIIDINTANIWSASTFNDESKSFIEISGFALIAMLGVSMVGSLFTCDAWNNVTFASEEVVNPKKTIPMSLLLGTGIAVVLYILANFVYLSVLPLKGNPDGLTALEKGIQFATDDRIGTAALSTYFGAGAIVIMAFAVLISTFGCNNGIILSGARIYYAMSKDNLFFKKVGELNKNGVPSIALILQCIWASLLCLSGTYSDLLDYVVFAVLIFYVLTILGIFILRVKKPEISRPYKAFGYPVLPAVYIILAMFILVILLIYKPNFTFPGLIIVSLGVPVYFIWKKIVTKKNVNKN